MLKSDNLQQNILGKRQDQDLHIYNFLSLFSALKVIKKDFEFDKYFLKDFIYQCKIDSKFEDLLHGIVFKNNRDSHHLNHFNRAIDALKNIRLLYSAPDDDSLIFIFEDIPILGILKMNATHVKEMNLFIDEYKQFEDSQREHNKTLKKYKK